AFVADDTTRVTGFLGRMARSAPRAFSLAFGGKAPERDRMAELRAAREITAEEREWLDARIRADDRTDAYEQALLESLAGEEGARRRTPVLDRGALAAATATLRAAVG